MASCIMLDLVPLLFVLSVLMPCPCRCFGDLNPNVLSTYNRTLPVTFQSEYGAAVMLPLSGSAEEHQISQHGRELVADARMNLHDDLLTKGYYTSRVHIGTPPHEFALIVDTGSTVTYVPCSTCTHCGSHQDPRFKPDASSSYQVINCTASDCQTGTCDDNQQCVYDRRYAEMSSSTGLLGRDQIGFGTDSRLAPQPLLFGCETTETGDLFYQHADGIMGLGRGPLSIVDQLVGHGAMANSFSLCYGGMDEGGGAMILGAIPPPSGMVFTPSDPNRSNYYNLLLKEVRVQGVPLELDASIFNGRYGTILDSGTTYAYLPEQAFDSFKEAVVQQLGKLQAVDGPDPTYHDICYAGAGNDPRELWHHFPPVDFVFGDDKVVSLAPENYLFKHTKVPGAYCLGVFKNQDLTTLLGGIVVRNMLVTYDRANKQIGFLRTNCTDLWTTLPPDTSPSGTPQDAGLPAGTLSPTPTPVDKPPANVPPNDESNVPAKNQTNASTRNGSVTSDASPSPSPSLFPPVFTPMSPAPAPACFDVQDIGGVDLSLALTANITTFSASSSVFLADMARELDLQPSQVSLIDCRDEMSQVIVQWRIVAAPGNQLSSTFAQRIIKRLQEHEVQLSAVFGTYNLSSWKLLPQSRGSSKRYGGAVVIAGVLTAAAILVAVAGSLVYWYLWRFRDQDPVKYTTVNPLNDEDGFEEL